MDPSATGLKRRVLHGAIVTYAAQAVRLVIQIASVIILSRLLAPEDFGLFAMVTPIYGLALLCGDLGMTQATIQRPQISAAQISALFWINMAISLALALLLALAAPAIGRFYGDPRAAGLVWGFAALIVVGALASQHLALINRRMRFRYLAVLDTVAFLLGFLGALLLAVARHSYWALFAAPALSALVTTIGAWAGARYLPGRPRRERDMRAVLRLGGGITAFNVFNFIARNLDNVLIGYAWGGATTGLYDRAYKLLLFPLQQINGPLARVMMPTLARLQHDPDRYRRAYLQALEQLLLVAQPGIVFTIATADMLVPYLLGESWRGAAPIFQWLGLAALQQPLSASTTWLFISQGRSRSYMFWGAFNAATSTAAFLAGLPWGPVGVAAAYSITQLCPRMPVLWWMATQAGPVRLRDIYAVAIPFALASAAAFLAISIVRQAMAVEGLCGLVLCLAVAYLAAAVALLALPRGRAILRQSGALIFKTSDATRRHNAVRRYWAAHETDPRSTDELKAGQQGDRDA